MKKTHYHGSPTWGGEKVLNAAYKNSCALVSFARPDQLKKILKIARSVVLDNGAFSTWMDAKKKNKVVDWTAHWARYYCFVLANIALIDWFIIPDVIEGTEEENDLLIEQLPSSLKHKAVPVWHSVESIERFVRLCEQWPRVAIGLCGKHTTTRSKVAQDRLTEAFRAIYVDRNIDVKIHGLRMLDGRVLGKFPLDSGDSTNVAINTPKYRVKYPEIGMHIIERWHYENGLEFDWERWKCKAYEWDEFGQPLPHAIALKFGKDKETKRELLTYRVAVLKGAIEKVTPPTIEEWVRGQQP